MWTTFLGLLALLLCAGRPAHAAASPCGSLNFFPTAAQISGTTAAAAASVEVNPAITCSGSQACNWPAVLNKTAQEAYQADLGTTISAGGLLNVAVKEYGAKQLRLFFTPSSPLLTANANAQGCVLASMPAATRKLMAATYSVTNPGMWSYTVAFSNGGTLDGGNKAAGETGDFSFPTTGTEDNIKYCAAIRITLKGYTVSNAPTGFPAQIPLTFNVCWYKHNGQARATFKFGTCKNGTGFAVNVSSISPLAQNLTQDGEALLDEAGKPRLLIQPVVQVFGRMNKTIDGNLVDKGAAYVNKYFLLPTDLKPSDKLTLSLDDGGDLEEGYYQISAKVAVITKFPSLVDLQGPATINQTDIDSIMGFTEYMGFLVRNGTDADTPLMGFQAATRVPAISDISADKDGVAIKAGDAITFTWQFVAAGTEQCYHDGVELTAVPCASPMIVAAKGFGANVTSHNFSVVITDVCGNTKAANFSYAADGAKALSAIDYVDPSHMDDSSGTFSTAAGAPATRKSSSSVSAAAPAATAAGLLKRAAAAIAASVLLMGALM